MMDKNCLWKFLFGSENILTFITSAHISLAKEIHVDTPEFKKVKMYKHSGKKR